jgi:hypothetical protein
MTQWTKEQYEELSEKVSRKFNLQSYLMGVIYGYGENYDGWLHESWSDVMELSVKYGIDAQHGPHDDVDYLTFYGVEAYKYNPTIQIITNDADHNNDKSLSERVARMLALMEVEL